MSALWNRYYCFINKKLRHREVKWLVEDHTVHEWYSQDSHLSCLAAEPASLTTVYIASLGKHLPDSHALLFKVRCCLQWKKATVVSSVENVPCMRWNQLDVEWWWSASLVHSEGMAIGAVTHALIRSAFPSLVGVVTTREANSSVGLQVC